MFGRSLLEEAPEGGVLWARWRVRFALMAHGFGVVRVRPRSGRLYR